MSAYDIVVISTDQELQATQDRIAHFQDLLAQFHTTGDPDEIVTVASGYYAELEKMQRELAAYLTQASHRKSGSTTRSRE